MTSEAKRDQRAYDLVQGRLPDLILAKIVGIVRELDEPYAIRPGIGGLRGYPPRAMAVACVIRDAERKTFRGMAGLLHCNRDLAERIGFEGGTPAKSTINDAYSAIPESYLYRIHLMVVAEVEGERGSVVAGDGTGYAERKTDRWTDFRTDRVRHRKGWLKLHGIIDVETRVILDYFVTRSRVSDITGMRTMLGRLGPRAVPGGADFCLDSAYLARDMCNTLAKLGFAPYIRPKRNTCRNARGSQPWRAMVDLYKDNLPEFKRHYHQRSIIEAVFGAVKAMYGGYVTCRRKDNERREIATRIICYNIELIARAHARSDRLARRSLGALAA